jgi:hypothetical protein
VLQVDQGAAPMGFPDLESGEEQWWHSYAKAEAVGLATELDLGSEAPGDIDALYVVGIGDTPPDALFEARRDAGTLGLIAPASPTNTVDGAPAADLGADAELWRQIAAGEAGPQAGAQQVSRMLTGKATTLDTLPGGDANPGSINQALVRALWPALWGHMSKDILGLGADVHAVGLWAGENLHPEGPLPALRIDDQPYGLLPAASLNDWLTGGGDPEVEKTVRPSLIRLRDRWAGAAEAVGNVKDADTARLLELVGHTASSNGYAYRAFAPLEALYFDYGIYSNVPFGLELLRAWWQALVAEVKFYPVDIQRAYLTYGQPQDLQIPLVEPDNLPEGITFVGLLNEMATAPPAFLLSENFRLEFLGGENPNSLLVRLILHALIVAGAELGREQAGVTGPVLEPMSAAGPETRLGQDVLSAVFPPPDPSTPAAQLLTRAQAAVAALAEQPVAALERAFKAVLDTAIYRVDPWITAYAWRRLNSLADKGFPHRLGVYGWVDAPAPGTPGPTGGGLLLAPSANQAHTAIILRDKAIHDPEADRWRMNLESRTIRIADRLAAEVRLGFHLYEVLGREVERIVGSVDQIDALRAHYPMRAGHAGRRVCNGQTVLEEDPAVLADPPFQLGTGTLDALVPLRDALDVYGDLLVAQAVHHVVAGRADAAGAAMDAAAGLTAPPDLEVVRTPRGGRAVGTSVLFCLPPAADEPLAGLEPTTSPTRVADPAVAAWIGAEAGFASEPGAFDWQVRTGDGSLVDRTLGQLGLVPSDTCTLSAGALRELVLASVADGVEVLADAPGDRAHAKARAIVRLLGNRPAVPEDLVAAADDTTPGEDDVANELRQRLADLRAVGEALVGELQAAVNSVDEAVKSEALVHATRWGIVPLRDARRSLQQRTADARDALQARLDAAPDGTAAESLQAADLATAIAKLAAPDGHYGVLARINFDDLSTTFGAAALDEEWLSLNATVRPILANLETYQLATVLEGAPAPLRAWSNRPGDPWQASEPADDNGRVPDTHLVAAYGPAGVLDDPSGARAVGLIDSWSEVWTPITSRPAHSGSTRRAPGRRRRSSSPCPGPGRAARRAGPDQHRGRDPPARPRPAWSGPASSGPSPARCRAR